MAKLRLFKPVGIRPASFLRAVSRWIERRRRGSAESALRPWSQPEELESRTLFTAGIATPTFVVYQGPNSQTSGGGLSGDASPGLGTSSPTGFTPAQIRHAYGIDDITFGSTVGDGTGQTIAIIDAYSDPNVVSDLATFDTEFSLPTPSLTVLNENGGTTLPGTDPAGPNSTKGSWAGETSLDVQWAHAIAPQASIVLFEANSASDSDLLTAVNTARNMSGVSVVSMSFGSTESAGETSEDTDFTTPAGHIGVTFFASSGDNGAGVSYPAASPNVVGVGGTSLTTSDSLGTYSSESAWSGSGGGISADESKPTYQAGVTQSSSFRTVPDVAAVADPSTGVPIVDSFDFGASTPWAQFGGTSLAAPFWGGLMTIVDQGSILAGGSTLDGSTQTLPRLYNLAGGNFHDITTGTSGNAAAVGYDLVTGLGTPIASNLALTLSGYSSSITTTTTVGANVNPAALNQTVTFSATVAPGSGSTVPTGSIAFEDGTALLGTANLNSSGVASYSTSSLTQGAHSITAIYSGDSNFIASTSSVLTQNVIATSNITIQIDYSHDTNDFFDTQAKKDILQLAANALVANFQNQLSAITPSGGNSWFYTFSDPATGSTDTVSNPTIAANTIILYAGGQSGIGVAEAGGTGFSASGTSAFLKDIEYRGQAGAAASTPTAYSPYAGVVSFDTGLSWYFGATTSGLTGSTVDFLTVAEKEIAFVLGFGSAPSWTANISGSNFVGANAEASYGGPVPLDTGNGDDYWASGTTSGGQTAAMTSSVSFGVRTLFTPLDYAGLEDIGWIIPPSTTTSAVTYSNPAAVTEFVRLTTTVTPASGTLDGGTVQFFDGSDVLGTGILNDSTGVAYLDIGTILSVGAYSITAIYSGDTSFAASSSTASTFTVVGTTTTLTPLSESVALGQTVTFSSTTTASSDGPITSGSVSWQDGNTALTQTALSASDIGTYATSFSTTGAHYVIAFYQNNVIGSVGYLGSNSGFTTLINVLPTTVYTTTTVLASTPSNLNLGVPVDFTASVTPSGGATLAGSVLFEDNGVVLGTVALVSGSATYDDTGFTTVGTHVIVAFYTGKTVGNAYYSPSNSGTATQIQANPATVYTTTTALTPSATTVTEGVAVDLTASVTPSGGGTLAGNVVFEDNGVVLGTVALVSGLATYHDTGFTTLGTHVVVAYYGGKTVGNVHYNASNSGTATHIQVNPATVYTTTTVLESTPATLNLGVPVDFTASVTPSGGSTLAGNIVFEDGGVILGTVALVSGIATYHDPGFTTTGIHYIKAYYSGKTVSGVSYNTSNSGTPAPVTVQALATVSLAANGNTSSASVTQPTTSGNLTLVSTVTGANGPVAGLIVYLYDGSTKLSSGTVKADGTTDFAIPLFSLGTHSLTVVFVGNSTYSSITSATVSLDVE